MSATAHIRGLAATHDMLAELAEFWARRHASAARAMEALNQPRLAAIRDDSAAECAAIAAAERERAEEARIVEQAMEEATGRLAQSRQNGGAS